MLGTRMPPGPFLKRMADELLRIDPAEVQALADVPGDESNEGGRGLGEQAQTGGPLLPEFTRGSHGLDKHADSVSWAERPDERTPKH